MPVYVVVVKKGKVQVAEQIAALPKDSVYALSDNSWLVDYEATTQAFAEAIKIRTNNDVSAIAFPISNYSGRFPTDVWEWLKLHMVRRGEN
ncbi:hypothetical protein [Devosia sp. CN2-171]|uniref:hypothetical protein n=1 Tax=Devosia sp. CN2-171 TaxID=3400909 RepID=UPI003BF82165